MSTYEWMLVAEMLLDSAAVLTLFLCLLVIIQCKSLALNIKILLTFSLLSQSLIILSQIAIVSSNLSDGHYVLSMAADSDDFLMVFHEIGYVCNSLSTLYMICERFYASKRLGDYERVGDAPFVCACIIVFSLAFATAWSYIVHVHSSHIFGCLSLVVMDGAGITLSITSYFYSVRKYRATFGTTTLVERYQMSDVLEYSRSVLPACLTASAIKFAGMVPVIIWVATDAFAFTYPRMFFFMSHTVTCLLMKLLLIYLHRGLNRTMYRLLGWKRIMSVTPISTGAETTAHYFKLLQSSWNETPR